MKYIKIFLLFILGLVVLALLAAGRRLLLPHKGLPDIDILEDYTPNLTTRVFADDGQMIAEFFIERRIVVPLKRMPEHLKHAFWPLRTRSSTPMRVSTIPASCAPL